MRKQKLGKTGLKVSRLCIGMDIKENLELQTQILIEAFRQGVNFWDTAENYGTQPAIKAALKVIPRNKVVIATKTYANKAKEAEADFNRAIEEMGTCPDIMLLHSVDTEKDFSSRKKVVDYLVKLKEQGKIKAIGVSTHASPVVDFVSRIPPIDVILTVMNKFGVAINIGNKKASIAAIKRAVKAGKGVYGMKVFGKGTENYEELLSDIKGSIEYVLKIKELTAIAIGIESLKQLNEDLAVVKEFEKL